MFESKSLSRVSIESVDDLISLAVLLFGKGDSSDTNGSARFKEEEELVQYSDDKFFGGSEICAVVNRTQFFTTAKDHREGELRCLWWSNWSGLVKPNGDLVRVDITDGSRKRSSGLRKDEYVKSERVSIALTHSGMASRTTAEQVSNEDVLMAAVRLVTCEAVAQDSDCASAHAHRINSRIFWHASGRHRRQRRKAWVCDFQRPCSAFARLLV